MGKKKHKLKWPRIGATHPVPLYELPAQGESETEDAFAERVRDYEKRQHLVAHVRLLCRDRLLEWEQEQRKIWADDQRRAKEDADYASSVQTLKELTYLNRMIVHECCVRLEGAICGDVDLEEKGLPADELVEMIEGMDLLGAVADACRRGQSPTPVQLDS